MLTTKPQRQEEVDKVCVQAATLPQGTTEFSKIIEQRAEQSNWHIRPGSGESYDY